ncbi:hypothetical protein VTI28DRAFT_8987 [Corynascus sepedonium]
MIQWLIQGKVRSQEVDLPKMEVMGRRGLSTPPRRFMRLARRGRSLSMLGRTSWTRRSCSTCATLSRRRCHSQRQDGRKLPWWWRVRSRSGADIGATNQETRLVRAWLSFLRCRSLACCRTWRGRFCCGISKTVCLRPCRPGAQDLRVAGVLVQKVWVAM